MKHNYYLIIILLFSLASCSAIEKQRNTQVEKRTFQIRKAWVRQSTASTNLAFRKINRMSPVLFTNSNGQEFVIQANAIDGVVSYTRDNGKEVWRLSVPNGVESSATIIKDRLFFGGNDGQFYSVDANNGKVLWTFPTRIENLAEPLLDEGVLYFLTGNNSVYALDAASGKQLWLYVRQDPNILSIRGGSKPAIRNGTLYVGFSDGYVCALIAKNGAVKWEKQLNRNKKFKDIDVSPLVDGEFLYLHGYDDQVYSLRAATGDIVWKAEKGGYGNILSLGDKLYFASTNNEFVAIDKGTGKRIWAHSTSEGIATSASLYKGLVVFGESQGELKFLDSGTGRLIQSFNPGRGIMSPPTVDEKNNLVFFISNEANIYALKVGWDWPKAIPYLR